MLAASFIGNTESAASLFDSRPSGHSRSDALSMALGLGAGGMTSAYGSYMNMGMGMGMGYDQNEDEYYDQDGEDGEEGENDDDEELDGEDYYHLRHMASGSGKAGGKPIYGFPSTYPHNGKYISSGYLFILSRCVRTCRSLPQLVQF